MTAVRPRSLTRRFYVGIGLFVIVLSWVGFGASLADQSLRHGPPSPLLFAHGFGVMAFLWLFVAQAWLIATGRTATHRRLGWAGAVLALAIITIGVPLSVATARRGHDFSGDLARAAGGSITPDGVLFPLLSFLNFGLLVGAAILFRRRPAVHKRLMLLAIIEPLAMEPVAHLYGHMIGYWPNLQQFFPVVSAAAMLSLLSVSAIHDWWTERRIHPVSLWVPIAMFAWINLQVGLVLPSAEWRRITEWLIRG